MTFGLLYFLAKGVAIKTKFQSSEVGFFHLDETEVLVGKYYCPLLVMGSLMKFFLW